MARVEAGASWQEVLTAAAKHGLTGLAGSTGAVSVTGFVLGGGLSWFSRKHGFAANSVVAFELVDAHGEHQRVTAQSDPDLFWALRGGGGDYAHRDRRRDHPVPRPRTVRRRGSCGRPPAPPRC